MDPDLHWLYFDGPEPEPVRPLLDALRVLPPVTPEVTARMARAFFLMLDAQPSPGVEAVPDPPREAPPRAARPLVVQEPDDDDPAPVAPVPSPPPEPVRMGVPVPPAPRSLAGTALTLNLPAAARSPESALPFLPPEKLPSAKQSPRTLQVPVMRPRLGGTAPVGDDAIARAVASLPFAGVAARPDVVPIPPLTLVQYASLCAELTVWPDRVSEIRTKYHVPTVAAHMALDLHWQEHFARHPEDGRTFQTGCASYAAWLRSQPR